MKNHIYSTVDAKCNPLQHPPRFEIGFSGITGDFFWVNMAVNVEVAAGFDEFILAILA